MFATTSSVHVHAMYVYTHMPIVWRCVHTQMHTDMHSHAHAHCQENGVWSLEDNMSQLREPTTVTGTARSTGRGDVPDGRGVLGTQTLLHPEVSGRLVGSGLPPALGFEMTGQT